MNPNRWSRAPLVVLMASGPSLRLSPVEALAGLPVLAVNDSWRRFPAAEILYAADAPWWKHHDWARGFAGERWTQHRGPRDWPAEAAANGLQVIRSAPAAGVSVDPALVHTGSNSGFQLLNLAVLGGARRIALLGYDMGPSDGLSHWFGDHPGQLNKSSPYAVFRRAFDEAAPQIEALGVEVINCSVQTSLTCFPRADLLEILRR